MLPIGLLLSKGIQPISLLLMIGPYEIQTFGRPSSEARLMVVTDTGTGIMFFKVIAAQITRNFGDLYDALNCLLAI